MKLKKSLGSLALLLAAVIWGFAFVAQSSGAEKLPAFTINTLRSFVAFAFLSLIIGIISIKNKAIIPKDRTSLKSLMIGGISCGVALFVATGFQQYGIGIYPPEAASSGRSGFITALYVILVPLVSAIFLKKRVPVAVWSGVALSIGGLYLLCFGNGIDGVYLGDLIIFFCALSFCGHILVVDHFVAKNNGILLSAIQFLTVGILSLITSLILESVSMAEILDALLPILYLGIMSSGIAYTLQIVGQKHTDPTVATILMSLESVFAVLGGWLIRNEKLSVLQLTGCALVFAAILLAQIPEFRKNK